MVLLLSTTTIRGLLPKETNSDALTVNSGFSGASEFGFVSSLGDAKEGALKLPGPFSNLKSASQSADRLHTIREQF
jgi:hypothetical protein